MFQIELIICLKMDLALNNLQTLVCHETQTTNQLCQKLQNPAQCTDKNKKIFPNYIPKSGNFHGLLKIHKSKEIKIAVKTQKSEYIQIPNSNNLKFWPIVAGPSCSTSRFGKLQLFLYKIKS